MSKKRIVYVIVTFAIFTAISVSLFPVSRAEAETITIKAISAWPKNEPSVADDYLGFIKHANEMLKQKFPGQVEIKYLGGSEVIPIRHRCLLCRHRTGGQCLKADPIHLMGRAGKGGEQNF